MYKLLLILSCSLLINIAAAFNISYDQIPITPQTWEEVDLTYINTIDGKEYTEQANLLRPISWIKQNHLDKVGSTVHLNKEQLGVDTDVKVVAIKPIKLDYSNNSYEDVKPVIATFITYNNDVWDYTFKDEYGRTEVIHAVSGHPFYSADRQAFISIGEFKIGEHVKTDNNRLFLISKHQYIQKTGTVYNFEVYQQHNYIINLHQIIVHNVIGFSCLVAPVVEGRRLTTEEIRHHEVELADEAKEIEAASEVASSNKHDDDTKLGYINSQRAYILDFNQHADYLRVPIPKFVKNLGFKRPFFISAHGGREPTDVIIGKFDLLGLKNIEVLQPKEFVDLISPKIRPTNPDCIVLGICHAGINGLVEQFSSRFSELPIIAPSGDILSSSYEIIKGRMAYGYFDVTEGNVWNLYNLKQFTN